MGTDRANLGGLLAHMDMAAIAALPDVNAVLLEHHTVVQVFQKGTVTLLVLLLDLAYPLKEGGQLVKALGPGGLGHFFVHRGPLFVLAGGGSHQIGGSVTDAVQRLEPQLGVLLLIVGGLQEKSGDLLIPFLLGLAGKIGLLVAGHALPSKSFPQVGLRFASFQFHCSFPLSK